MQNTITISCPFNPFKTVEFKQSKCHHFYQRQLIGGRPVTTWQRERKHHVQETMARFAHTSLIGKECTA